MILHQTALTADFIQNLLSQVAGHIYGWFAEDFVVVANKLIHLQQERYVVINQQCTALSLIASLLAAVFSLPITIMQKIGGALFVVVSIQIENIIRIIFLFNEIKKTDNLFDFYHLYLWQFINFVFALLIFALIVRMFKVKRHYA